MSNIPQFKKFKEDLMKICPDGDLQATWSKLDYVLDYNKDHEGNELTYEYIMRKYSEHIRWWNHTYGRGGDLKYVKAKDLEKKKILYDFLSEEKYNDEWIIQKGDISRDQYLFGEFSISYLKKLKDHFVSQFR